MVLAQDYEVAIAAELKCQQQAEATARTISLVNRYALHTRLITSVRGHSTLGLLPHENQ